MSDENAKLPADDFKERLQAAQRREVEAKQQKPTSHRMAHSGIAFGFRISIEFVVTIAVGTLIGYWIDGWLNTRPFLMILFLVLGGAAGVMNAYRTAKGYDESVGFGAAQKRAQESQVSEKDDRIV